MKFIEITDLQKNDDIKNLYEKSFPPEEKIDYYDFFSGVFVGFKLYGLYNNSCLIGIFHFNVTKSFIHLNYLAVDDKYQSQGFGSKILDWLKQTYNNLPIVVDIEEIDEKAPNNQNRIRRKHFYHKNAFVDGIYTFDWEGTFMTYVHYGNIKSKIFMEYIQKIFPTIKNVKKVDLI